MEWSNLKRATEKKIQTLATNESKPDDQKVNCKPLSPLDEIVLDILGKGQGLTTHQVIGNVEDIHSLNSFQQMLKYDDSDEDDEIDEVGNETETGLDTIEMTENPITANTIPMAKIYPKRKRYFAAHYPLTANYQLMELRKKKLRLECSKLELELEKMPLECAKLELEIQKLQRDLLTQPELAPDHPNSQMQQ